MLNCINSCVTSPDGKITLGIQTSLSSAAPVVYEEEMADISNNENPPNIGKTNITKRKVIVRH